MSAANPLNTIPTRSSTDAAWIGWYDILPFSQKDNNLLFMHAWKARGTKAANTQVLRKHLDSNGLTLSAENIFGDISDVSHGALDAVGSIFKVGATASMVFTGGLVIFTGFILWRILTPESVGIIAGTAVKTAL